MISITRIISRVIFYFICKGQSSASSENVENNMQLFGFGVAVVLIFWSLAIVEIWFLSKNYECEYIIMNYEHE